MGCCSSMLLCPQLKCFYPVWVANGVKFTRVSFISPGIVWLILQSFMNVFISNCHVSLFACVK
jgi:hypothetical protein